MEDLTLADLVGLDDTLRKIAPDWLDVPPFLTESARGNGRAEHIAKVLSKIKYNRRKISWLIAGTIPTLGAPSFRITAETRVLNEDGSGLLNLFMEDVEIPPDASDHEIVRRAFWILESFEQHETQEQFWYEDDKVYDPHTKYLPKWSPED